MGVRCEFSEVKDEDLGLKGKIGQAAAARGYQADERNPRAVILSEAKNLCISRIKRFGDSSSPAAPQNDILRVFSSA